jgi:hypothetical protein
MQVLSSLPHIWSFTFVYLLPSPWPGSLKPFIFYLSQNKKSFLDIPSHTMVWIKIRHALKSIKWRMSSMLISIASFLNGTISYAGPHVSCDQLKYVCFHLNHKCPGPVWFGFFLRSFFEKLAMVRSCLRRIWVFGSANVRRSWWLESRCLDTQILRS